MNCKLTVFIFIATMSTFASINDAEAISRNGARYLRSAKSTISISGLKVIKAYESGPVTRAVESHFKNLNSNLGRAISNFNRIPASDRGEPEVQQLGRQLKALSDHFQIIKARVSNKSGNDAAEKGLHFAFKKKYGSIQYQSVIKILNEINANPNYNALAFMLGKGATQKRKRNNKKSWREESSGGASSSAFADFKSKINTLKAACNGEFKGIKDHRHYSLSIETKFGTWCMLVNKSDELIRTGLTAAVNGSAKVWLGQIDDAVDILLNKSGFIFSRTADWIIKPNLLTDRIKTTIAEYSAAAGVTLDDSVVLAKIRGILAKALVILNNKAKKHVMRDAGYKHSAGKIDGYVRSKVRSDWKKNITFKKVKMYRDGYTIVKHAVTGIPLRRSRGGAVLYKKSGEKWCRVRSFEYTEPYLGGGRYANKGTFSFSEMVRIQKCE